jgi:ribonuclease J
MRIAQPHANRRAPAEGTSRPGDLIFLPLGGSGEIGMNLNLYGLDGKWLMIDCGMGFAEPNLPGIEVVVPDPSFIVERREDLLAIVLTHAHEDHLGAVGHLWPQLRCPVYATAFAAAILRRKLSEFEFADDVPIHDLDGGTLSLGPFTLDFIGLTHSIPEMRAVAIRTRHGTVLHTGDWKLDPDPVVGPVTDDAALRRLGDEGVLALICDSTNVLQPEASGSEAAVRDSLIELVGKARRRVLITTFASNVARVAAVAAAAQANHRDLAIVGRSLRRTIEAARETGYLHDLPTLLDDEEGAYLPPDKALLLCTGCQGEPNGAMSRIASGAHKHVVLEPGDTVIFSSKIIPGNERSLYRLYNLLAERGVEVLTEKEHFVHVSGHPGRPELERLYRWVRPRVAVPVHGEPRHLVEHVALAKRWQVPEAVMIENGSMLRLAPGAAEKIGEVTAGRLAVDGKVLTPVGGSVLRARKKLAWNGAAVITLVVTARGTLATPPRTLLQGVPDDAPEGVLAARVDAALAEAFEKLPAGTLKNDELVIEIARRAARQVLAARGGKRPPVEVQIIRLPG